MVKADSSCSLFEIHFCRKVLVEDRKDVTLRTEWFHTKNVLSSEELRTCGE